jgi:uncharacterized membrane protein YccC
MSAAVALVALVDPSPGPLVLAAVLAMTLSRNRLITTWRGRTESLILLPVVAFATAGVGFLLVYLPIVGATAYVVAMFLSVWLRRFGPLGSRIGSLIALPFITLLIAPGAGLGITPPEIALLSVVVLVIVVALRLLAEVIRLVPRARPEPLMSVQPGQAGGLRPIASTRMAIQLAIALAASFVLGDILFPGHTTWVVLTAFIVCSANRGRADVLYKSGLRIVGAAIGTTVASLGLALMGSGHPAFQGPTLVVMLLALIGVGLWLREWTYAAWAVIMTLVITLLQGVAIPVAAGTGAEELWERILAIIVGAILGLAASWFVLPVRSESVVRKRIAAALAAVSEYAAERTELADATLSAALNQLDEVAKPWEAWERISFWRTTSRKPGQWMELVHECAALVRNSPRLTGEQRRALGAARQTLRDPLAIGPALLALRDELAVD